MGEFADSQPFGLLYVFSFVHRIKVVAITILSTDV